MPILNRSDLDRLCGHIHFKKNDGDEGGSGDRGHEASSSCRSWADIDRRLRNPARLTNMIAVFGRDADGAWGLQVARDLNNGRLARAAADDILDAYTDPEDPRHKDAVAFMEGTRRFENGQWTVAGGDQGFSDIVIRDERF